MKSIRYNTLLRTLALGVLTSCLGAVVANAQSFRGTFSLPAEVRWGTATLQAAACTFSSEGVRTGNALQLFQDGRPIATLLSQAHNPAMAGRAALVIEQGKGGSSVREIRLPEIGVTLYYAPYKPAHGTASEERQVAQVIPIAVTGTL
jgi:hypothetical protein